MFLFCLRYGASWALGCTGRMFCTNGMNVATKWRLSGMLPPGIRGVLHLCYLESSWSQIVVFITFEGLNEELHLYLKSCLYMFCLCRVYFDFHFSVSPVRFCGASPPWIFGGRRMGLGGCLGPLRLCRRMDLGRF